MKIPLPVDKGLPEQIDTELGDTVVSIVRDINAHRDYLCPLCDTTVDQGTEHVLLVPTHIPRLRRHAHTDCVCEHVTQGIEVKLHPKEPDVTKYYFLGNTRTGP